MCISPYFDTVKQYLLGLDLSIVSEDFVNSLVVVEDEDRGLKNLVVDCEEPLLVFEQIIRDYQDLYKQLTTPALGLSRTICGIGSPSLPMWCY